MRPRPNCPEPDSPTPPEEQVRVRPRPHCDPDVPTRRPDFSDPATEIPLAADLKFPRDLTLAGSGLQADCSSYIPYLADQSQDIPDGDLVNVLAGEVVRVFRWNDFPLTTGELNNLGTLQDTEDLAARLEGEDAQFFAGAGVSQVNYTAFFTRWQELKTEIEAVELSRAQARLDCRWCAQLVTVNCPDPTDPNALIPTLTSELCEATSPLSQEDANLRVQNRLLSQLDCRVPNEEQTVSCESKYTEAYPSGELPELIPSLTIPAGQEFGTTQSEANASALALITLELECPVPNTQVSRSCTDLGFPVVDAELEPGDPARFGLVNAGTVSIAPGSFAETLPFGASSAAYAESLARVNASAVAAALTEIVCEFTATVEARCCCYPEIEDAKFSVEKEFGCVDKTIGIVGAAEEDPLFCNFEGCTFKTSKTEAGDCTSSVTTGVVGIEASDTSFLSYDDARINAINAAAMNLVCEHANVEITYDSCPPGFTLAAQGDYDASQEEIDPETGNPIPGTGVWEFPEKFPIVIPAGTVPGTNMTDVNQIARIYGQTLLVCNPKRFEATVTARCNCIPGEPQVPPTGPTPPDGFNGARRCLSDRAFIVEDEPLAESNCLFLTNGLNQEGECVTIVTSTPPEVTVTARSQIDMEDARQLATSQALAELVCDHTNEEQEAADCPDGFFTLTAGWVPQGVVTADTQQDANALAMVYAKSFLECVPLALDSTPSCSFQVRPAANQKYTITPGTLIDGTDGPLITITGLDTLRDHGDITYLQVTTPGLVASLETSSAFVDEVVLDDNGVQTAANYMIGGIVAAAGGDPAYVDQRAGCHSLILTQGFINGKIVRVFAAGNRRA